MAFGKASVQSSAVGRTLEGKGIDSWVLRSSGGLELEVLTYGGIVKRLMVPDKKGNLSDVVLGFEEAEAYLGTHPFFGATAGRVAGRITKGQFTLDGKEYSLEINDPPNHLHSGNSALDKQVWTASEGKVTEGGAEITLSFMSPDGDSGYPGRARLSVTYIVTADNRFIFETKAEALDLATPVSLTHHSYFNLSGDGGSVLDHSVQIFSDMIASCDDKMGLLGNLKPLEGSAADLRESKRIGDIVSDLWQEHGDLYKLETQPAELLEVARVMDPYSGRVMLVKTDCPYLQFYAGKGTEGFEGKDGKVYPSFGGLCFECEGYPDGVNTPEMGDIIVHPGKPHVYRTEYCFCNL